MMKLDSQNIQKWLFSPLSVLMIFTIALSYSDPSFSYTTSSLLTISMGKPGTQEPQGIYRNIRFGFQFNYSSQNFVINSKTSRINSKLTLAIIDIWTKKHAQKIEAGAYEGGTEYPANVQVTVYKNPQKLSLRKWLQQSETFPAPRKLINVKMAGQNAIQFEASGLYENKHIAVMSPKTSNIIVVTLSQIGDRNNRENDTLYGRAYQEIVKSFKFNIQDIQ